MNEPYGQPEDSQENSQENAGENTAPHVSPSPYRTDFCDEKPPMISPARGPMNQQTPDVPTGSTPLTRKDD